MIRRQVQRSQLLPRFLWIGMPLVLFLAILAVSARASAESCINVAGTWDVWSEVDATACGEGQFPENNLFIVTQDGCNFVATVGSMTYVGTVSGNEGHLSTIYIEDGYTFEETSVVTIDGNTISGTSSWTMSGFGDTCSGTTQVSGTLENAPSPPESATLEGAVKDTFSAQPVNHALISLSPGGYEIFSGTDGTFSVSGLPPGTYTVEVSAFDYITETLPSVTMVGTVSNHLNVSLIPYSPQVLDASASPFETGNDGQGTTLLSVRVTHPLELPYISSVFGDLSQIGGSAQQAFYDDGTHGDGAAGDGTYSFLVTVAKGIKARLYALNVTAVDCAQKKGLGAISLKVNEKVSGSVAPSQSGVEKFDNTLDGQDLNIHFDFSKTISALKTTTSECQVVVTIRDPNGVPYGPYYGTDAIDINIPNAAEGQWEYSFVNQCASALSYEVETSGAGTGMLVGRVMDGFSGAGVLGASVNCNTGGTTMSLDQGYFSGVAVAGTGQVRTSKAGYQTNVRNGVCIKAGTTTNLNIQVIPLNASAQATPSGVNIHQVVQPSEEPNPPAQPFAAQVSGTNLDFSVLFPRYQQAVDLYLGLTIDAPQHAGKLYLLNQDDEFVELTDTLHAWRKGTTKSEWAQGLISVDSDTFPFGDYTLYALVTTNSATLADYDLSYFTTTLAQTPPEGRNVTAISNPIEEPNPVTQPLAAQVTGGNLVLKAHFPAQAQPVTIYLAYSTPAGELCLFKQDLASEPFTGTVWPWRQGVANEQAEQILSKPTGEMSQGTYLFYSLVTTDPVSLSNFDLTYFALTIGD